MKTHPKTMNIVTQEELDFVEDVALAAVNYVEQANYNERVSLARSVIRRVISSLPKHPSIPQISPDADFGRFAGIILRGENVWPNIPTSEGVRNEP